MDQREINILILLSGPVLFGLWAVIYDWLARRQYRRQREHDKPA
jgi:hypothetical protein